MTTFLFLFVGKTVKTKDLKSKSKQIVKPVITGESNAHKFSAKKKKQIIFSYANLLKHRVNIKEFSFKDQHQLNLLKSKLEMERGINQKFSYTEALKKYLLSQKKIPVSNLKANVVDFLSTLDVVEKSVGQHQKTNIKPSDKVVSKQDIKPITPAGGSAGVHNIGIATIKEITKLIEALNINVQKAAALRANKTSETTTQRTTTEQAETEAPESEQSPTASTLVQNRCFCMEICLINTVFEGHCGKPDSFGVRKSKCCTSGGIASSAEEAEEIE